MKTIKPFRKKPRNEAKMQLYYNTCKTPRIIIPAIRIILSTWIFR